MKRCILLLSLCIGCAGPIHSLTYDSDIKWDKDQDYICHFNTSDKHLNCLGQQRTVNAVFKEVLNLKDMTCLDDDGKVKYCSCSMGKEKE